MKKISFIIVLALGLMACEKMETGPAVERGEINSGIEVVLETANEFPGVLPGIAKPGIDAINYPEIPGTGDTKGESKGNN